jgi:hypothetical protein
MLHSLPSSKLWQPRWLWLLLVVGGVGVWGGRQAEASCGDYVLIGNRHAAMMLEMSGGHAAAAPSNVVSNRWGVSDKPSAPAPCHGPQCRQRKAPKGLPVPTVVSLEPAEALLSELADLSTASGPSGRALAQHDSFDQCVGRGLYRPPRIS